MSDLHDPVGDPDDHYDLAVGFGIGTLKHGNSIIVVDEAEGKRPNLPSVRDLASLMGRKPPVVFSQRRVSSQIRFLRASRPNSVRVITLGSLTGVAALLKRNRKIVESRVRTVTVFAGDAEIGAEIEANVSADPKAFVDVLRSGLKVRWVPCFDGGLWSAGTSSFVSTTDEHLLSGVRRGVFSWFQRYIGHRFGIRNLWAAGVLSSGKPPGTMWTTGTFIFSDEGTLIDKIARPSAVRKLTVVDRQLYEVWLIRRTRSILASL